MRDWKEGVVIRGLEMLSGRGKKENAKEAQVVAETDPDGLALATIGTTTS